MFDERSKDPVIAFTDAPTNYDWGWCRTEAENVGVYDKDGSRPRILRKVRIEDGYHAKMQLGRYGSGLHLALDAEEYRKWVEDGLIDETPEKEIVHRRTVINLPEDLEMSTETEFFKRYEHYAYGDGKTDNVIVESGAFGGGGHQVSVYVIGDKKLFHRIVHELKATLGIA